MGPASVPLPLETRSRSKTASHAGTGGSSAIMAESRRRPSMLRSIVPPLAEKGALSRSFAPARESGEEEFIPRAPSRAPPSLPPHALPAGALAPPTFHPELPSLLIRSSAGEAGTLTSDPPLLTRTGIPSDTSASGRLNECALPQLSGTNTEWYK